jgi:flavin-dependent dehydrogenase
MAVPLSVAMESRLNQLAFEPSSRWRRDSASAPVHLQFEAPTCESTITLQDAAEIDWDVVVVGAGPTGALAARQLAFRGLRTLLVDRGSFPREKVCGGCISGLGRRLLAAVGLESVLDPSVASPLSRLDLAAAGRRVSFELPLGSAISRFHLDARLVREAHRAGAAFVGEATTVVRGLSQGCRFRTVVLQHEDRSVRARARMVIAADGLGRMSLKRHRAFASQALVSSRMGLGATLTVAGFEVAPWAVLMSVARDGYVGLVQLPGDSLNLAAAVDPNLVRQRGPAAAVYDILMRAGVTPPAGLEAAVWRGTGLLTRRSPRMSARRLLVLGDAAGYIEPFTGEGMTWGMLSAVLAAPLVDEWLNRDSALHGDCVAAKQDCARFSRDWKSLYRARIAPRQRHCRMLSNFLRHPAAVRAAMRLISEFPALARPLIGHFWDSGNILEELIKTRSNEGSIDAIKMASRVTGACASNSKKDWP